MPHKEIVFIIDDDQAFLRSLKRLLNAYGFNAEVFDSVESFCASANPQDGLCLVLDVHLNGGDSLEFGHQLLISDRSLPVIFMTADDTEHARRNAVEAGCVAYLQKPFLAKALVDAIKAAATAPDRLAR